MQLNQLIEQAPTLTDPFWNFTLADVIIAIGTIAAIGISIYALKVEKSKAKSEDKKYVREAMEKAFARMKNEKQIKARQTLYQIYASYKKDRDLGIYRRGIAPEVVEEVRLMFDELNNTYGFDDNLKKAFIATFWTEIIDSWRCMEDHIKYVRKQANTPNYAEGFEVLYKEALEFRRLYKSDVPIRTD
jgi:hypothetical protein